MVAVITTLTCCDTSSGHCSGIVIFPATSAVAEAAAAAAAVLVFAAAAIIERVELKAAMVLHYQLRVL